MGVIQTAGDATFTSRDARASGTWLNVVSHLDPRYGGLSAAVPALNSSVAAASDAAIVLSAFCKTGEHFRPVAPLLDIHYFSAQRLKWFRDAGERRAFGHLVAKSTGLHIHGLWDLSTTVASRAARAAGKPYIISAHGMLESWALANKGRKKQIYGALFERANLQGAACLHALTRAELQDYRAFGLRNPVAVIPNGVDIPSQVSAETFLSEFPELRGKQLVLFLGRIHRKKGLDILAQAWASLGTRWPEAQLVLAGPDFENTQAEIQTLLASLGIEQHVTFTEMLSKELKWSALRAARIFVLPSYSEGLSVSVLEAMGSGLPVVVTEQCNLPEVAERSCGWVIQPRADELASAIEEALCASSSRLAELASNGRHLISTRYSWQVVGEQMSSLYRWIEDGARPGQLELVEAA